MTFPMDPTGGIAGSPMAASADVTADIPCRKCSYNLRGMPLAGRCPECGTPVGVSVHGELLRFSDPEFVLTLRKGVSLILWGILIMFVVVVIGAIVGAMVGVAGVGSASPYISLLGLVGYLPMLWGTWLLTTPDPSGIGEDRYGTPRKIVRFALAVGVASFMLDFGTGIAGAVSPATRYVLVTIAFLVGIIRLVGYFAQLFYLHKLALRIPDVSLSDRAKSIMWGFGVCYGLMMVTGFIAALSAGKMVAAGRGGAGVPGAAIGLGCFAGLAAIAAMVYGIMYLLMLLRFNRSLEEQAGFARQIWAGGAAPPPLPPVT